MGSNPKKTYFLFVSGMGYKDLERIRQIIQENPESYMNVLCLHDKLPNPAIQSRLDALRKSYFDRVLVREIKIFRSNHIFTCLTLNIGRRTHRGKLREAVQQFITDLITYAKNEEYLVLGSPATSKSVERVLRSLDIENSRIH